MTRTICFKFARGLGLTPERPVADLLCPKCDYAPEFRPHTAHRGADPPAHVLILLTPFHRSPVLNHRAGGSVIGSVPFLHGRGKAWGFQRNKGSVIGTLFCVRSDYC